MKKHTLLCAAALGAASFMMLSGFDSAETAESILQKCQEADTAAEFVNAAIDMKADVAVEIPDMGMTLDVNGTGTMTESAVVDPLSMSMTSSFSGSAAGQSGELAVDMYLETAEDGSMVMYIGMGDEWVKSTLDTENADLIRSAMTDPSFNDISDMPLTLELADAPVTAADGSECYELSASLEWADIKELINWSVEKVEASGLLEAAEGEAVAESEEDITSTIAEMQGMLDLLDSYVAGLKINITTAVDTETYQMKQIRLDMDGSDWENLALVAASALGFTNEDGSVMAMNINVNDLYMEVAYDYETAADTTVPEDVKANAVEAEGDLDEAAVSALADAAEVS